MYPLSVPNGQERENHESSVDPAFDLLPQCEVEEHLQGYLSFVPKAVQRRETCQVIGNLSIMYINKQYFVHSSWGIGYATRQSVKKKSFAVYDGRTQTKSMHMYASTGIALTNSVKFSSGHDSVSLSEVA